MASPGSVFEWSTCSRDDFERLVEALLVREAEAEPGLYARAIDGRGGDGGIDVDVRVKKTDELIRIFQLKHFPEGFSGGHRKSRWPQIKNSFNEAMKVNPRTWTLVIPGNGTVQERKSVSALKGTHKVIVRFIGRAELDGLLAKHPDLHDMFTRDAARSALAIVRREQAVPATVTDVAAEVRRATALGGALSPYWGVNTSVQDGVETHALYAKRPDAAEREPLTLTTELTFASHDEALRQAFLDKLNYGTSARVVLPSNVVRRFAIKGAPWIATESIGGELELIAPPSDLAGRNVYMTTRDADGQVLDEISGVASHVGSGTNGVSLEMGFPGGLTQVWRFSGTQDEMTSQVNFNMAGQSGRSAARAHQFVSTFDNASTVEIELDGRTMKVVLTDTALRSLDAGVASFVDDLAFIERELNVEFAFPDGETGVIDRIWTRVICRILEGRAVLAPLGVAGYSATLTGEESDGLEDMLTKAGQVLVTHFDWRFTLFGTRLRLGAVSYYHPHLQVADGAGHLAAICAGAGAGRKMHFTAENDMPFTIVSTTRLDGDGVSVEPWEIPGVPEHPTLAAVQARTKTIPVPP